MNRDGTTVSAASGHHSNFLPTILDLVALFQSKYDGKGWGPALRISHDYFSPDDFYEATVDKLVTVGCKWADVGCGRDIFPSNSQLAEKLASRAELVFGIDPDPNVRENKLLTHFSQTTIEECETVHRFDVITLRMVAEHIVDPDAVMAKLAKLLKPEGLVVIYTPYKWAPMSIIASIIPFRLHNPLKWLIWRTEARDTFPTAYKLNTRNDLDEHTSRHHLREVAFRRIDDCRITGRFKFLQRIELRSRKLLRALGIPYPEACLLAVYRRD